MDSLIASNIRQRPTRTLVSVAGVALGVILIVVNTSLVRGMLSDRMTREQGLGAEIQFSRKGSSVVSVSSILSLDVRYGDRLKQIEGVADVSPVGRYVQRGSTGFGIEQLDGIDFESYQAISGLRIISGRVFQNDNEVIIDDFKAEQSKLTIGSDIPVFGQTKKVVGIYTPPSGSRIKMSLKTLQDAQSAPDKCTFIMVKCKNPADATIIQERIDNELPGNIVVLTRDIATGFGRALPGIDGFIRSVLILSTIVSTLVILIAMYTTITERTREIGILKSLGASKSYIVGLIEKEALAISLIGVLAGIAGAGLVTFILGKTTTLQLEFDWKWVLISAVVGLAAGVLGALYPALRAAKQDPVAALSYE